MKNSNTQYIGITLICVGIILVVLDFVKLTNFFGVGFIGIVSGVALLNRNLKTVDIDIILYILEIDIEEKKQIYSLDKGLLFKEYKNLQTEYRQHGYIITLVSATTFHASLGKDTIKVSLKTNPLLSD